MREDWIEVEMKDDWTWVELKELTLNPQTDIVDGPFGSNLKSSEFVDYGIPVFKIQNIKANSFLEKNINYVTPEKAEKLKRHTFKKGDLIITKLGNPLGLCCKVPGKYTYGVIVADLIRFRPNYNIILDKFLVYGINSILVQNQFKSITKGTTRPRVNLTIVRGINFPLAPLPEQRAIVAKIEQLFSELDHGIANLQKAKEKLEIYRQAVLKKAFEGELTKEWREKQSDLPSADELLEQIKEKRLKQYEKQLQEWQKAVDEWEANGKEGKRPTRISKPKIIQGSNAEEIELYGYLPEKWKWTRFCNVTYKIGDIDHKMPKDFPGGLPYLSTGDLKSNETIDFKNAKTISPEDYYNLSLKIKPEKGDIIFPRYGTIGRNVLINFDKIFLVSYSCAIIKNILKVMDEKFVYYYSISPVIKKEIKRYTVETTQANIGIASIESFIFPLCAIQEQTQIVHEIENRLSVCDNILANIDEGLEKAEALRQSILKKAFEGRLLSKAELEACRREPDWEPAEKLLERIKQDRKEEVKI